MKVLFVVNKLDELIPLMTTSMLISRAAQMRWAVSVAPIADLGADVHGHVTARAHRLPTGCIGVDLQEVFISAEETTHTLEHFDVVFVRTNPARDPERSSIHHQALSLLSGAEDRGVRVINSPRGLRRTLDKSYLMKIPERLRPATVITRSYEEAARFFKSQDSNVVIKPLVGSRGNDVFFVNRRDEPNLRQIFAVITRQGFVMIQSFVPEAVDGDTRVVVHNGRVLEVGGHALALRRTPGKGELRSNIHAGGKPGATKLEPSLRQAADEIAGILWDDGIVLAGLDFAGSLLLEANVFSPGGFFDAERFYDQDFTGEVLATFNRWN
jgi:glutathione synthase